MARPRKDQKAEQARLDAEALDLYTELGSYRRVAERQDVSHQTVHDRVNRALGRTVTSRSLDWKAKQLAHLDFLEEQVVAVLTARHVKVDHGKVIEVEGEVLLDDAPVLQATTVMLRIWERRAKLLGTDAPTKSTVTVITEDAVDAEIRRLNEEMAGLDDDRSPSGEAARTT